MGTNMKTSRLRRERYKVIRSSLGWLLAVNAVLSCFVIFIDKHDATTFISMLSMLTLWLPLFILSFIIYIIIVTSEVNKLEKIRVLSCMFVSVLSLSWVYLIAFVIGPGKTTLVFSASVAILLSAVIPLYLSWVLLSLFSLPVLIACLIVGSGDNTVLNSLICLVLLSLSYSAATMLRIIHSSLIRRDRENVILMTKLKKLANYDPLTGLANRHSFNAYTSLLFKNAGVTHPEICVILIDIDFFKGYNDHYGHLKGDQCIVSVANAIRESTRMSEDFTARFGGEEFIVILQASTLEAIHVAERIKKKVGEMAILHENSPAARTVTVSQGIACKTDDMSMEQLIDLADKALYSAKSAGRDRYRVYTSPSLGAIS
ncbi:TPA: membrane-associated sensor domain-containing protein [Klebsiella aerogenes]|nr:membrane-associated sensor domain-containing protein [Klebsiella aerogenes]